MREYDPATGVLTDHGKQLVQSLVDAHGNTRCPCSSDANWILGDRIVAMIAWTDQDPPDPSYRFPLVYQYCSHCRSARFFLLPP